MRINIVLDDDLIAQALQLAELRSEKEVVNLALLRLVDSYNDKKMRKQKFIESYIENPIKMNDFTPLYRDEIYQRGN